MRHKTLTRGQKPQREQRNLDMRIESLTKERKIDMRHNTLFRGEKPWHEDRDHETGTQLLPYSGERRCSVIRLDFRSSPSAPTSGNLPRLPTVCCRVLWASTTNSGSVMVPHIYHFFYQNGLLTCTYLLKKQPSLQLDLSFLSHFTNRARDSHADTE